MLRVLGADVRPVPAVAYDNPNNYNHQVYWLTIYSKIFPHNHLRIIAFFSKNHL
jgi:hypothetical protein